MGLIVEPGPLERVDPIPDEPLQSLNLGLTLRYTKLRG